MLKGALLGFGRVAEAAHAPAFRARSRDFAIQAVADASPERLEKAAALFPGARLYADSAELLGREKGLDFADIATPPAGHLPLAQLALSHGLHALVEKPLVLSLKELASLKSLAESRHRCLFTIHNWKHAPQYLKLAELASSGALGEVRHVELHTLRTQPAQAAAGDWRSDPANGGILVDHGWHAFYLAKLLAGGEPRLVSCRGRSSEAGREEEAAVFIDFPRASALVHLSWAGAYRSNWALVQGTRAAAEMRDGHILVTHGDGRTERHDFASKVSEGSAHPDWFEAMLPEFAAELRDPRLRGRNLEEAETCLRLVTHAQQSQRLGGKSVAMPAPAAAHPAVPAANLN